MLLRSRNCWCSFQAVVCAVLIAAIGSFFGNFPNALAEEKVATEQLSIVTAAGSFDFDVEVADDAAERQVGLMHREFMEPKHGMLFVFNAVRPITMWMKNTPLSLDMLFIRPDGIISRIESRTTPFSEAIISSGGAVSHVLELNAGLSALIGAKPGDRVIHSSFSQ